MNTLIGKPLSSKSGYTHVISWKEKHKNYGEITKSFPTTRDAVSIHVKQMQVCGVCYDIEVKPYAGTKL